MSEPHDGGPAYPVGPMDGSFTGEDGYTSHQYPGETGMSLRDYFAAAALAGMTVKESEWDFIAPRAYQIADAMLVARSRTPITKEETK